MIKNKKNQMKAVFFSTIIQSGNMPKEIIHEEYRYNT